MSDRRTRRPFALRPLRSFAWTYSRDTGSGRLALTSSARWPTCSSPTSSPTAEPGGPGRGLPPRGVEPLGLRSGDRRVGRGGRRRTSIVGYAQARLDEPTVVESWGVVHPAHRGLGAGTSLFDEVEERATRLLDGHPAGRFRHSINAGDGAAVAMLHARGLRPCPALLAHAD